MSPKVGIEVASDRAMPRLRPSQSVLGFALVALLGLSSAACNRVRVEDARGPDHTDWKRISCSRMDKKCFKAAAELCPNGYYFAKESGSVPAAADTHAVHIDEDGEPVKASGARPAGTNVTTLPPQERWSNGMYSRKRGSILVQCAGATAKNDR